MEEFSIYCRCGTQIHTSDAHLGRVIRCRCGNSLPIARPGPATRSNSSSSPTKRRTLKRSFAQPVGRLVAAVGRAGRWLASELRGARAFTRWGARLQLTYLLGIVAAWLMLVTLSERWLPATLLAYGPRSVTLLPLALVVPIGLMFARRSLVFTAAAALLATSQIMGYRVSLSAAAPPMLQVAERSQRMRVLTLNSASGRVLEGRLDALIARYEPDVVALQECSPQTTTSLASIQGWYMARHHGLCTLSRWPIVGRDSMPRAEFARVRQLGFGGTALAIRYHIQHPTHPFHVVNLHLETARKGLKGLLGPDGLLPDSGGLPRSVPFLQDNGRVEANALIRRRESQRASAWAAQESQSMSVVVMGDFNLPVESTIYRESWRAWLNAFESKGNGFGYTKSEGRLLRIRIDHVLASSLWFEVSGAWIGPEVGSDHRPVIADLTFRERVR